MATEFNTGADATLNAAVKSRYEANSNTNAFTDAEQTKLAGIEASADVTDTTNVTAAGALMDSEVSSLSGVKTLTVPDSTTISSFGASLVDDASASAARTTLDAAWLGGATMNAQTGTTYVLVLSDAGKSVTMSNASANTLTIPTNASVAFSTGTQIAVTMLGAGTTTITGDTGVTVNGVSAGSGAISNQYGGVVLTKIGTNTWLIQGDHGGVS